MSDAETNKAVMRRFIEEYQTGGDEAVAREIIADDFVNHADKFPGMPEGKEGVLWLFAYFRQVFPGFRAVVHEMVAEDDRVVTHKTFHGTHEGEFVGIPPTGKEVAIELIDIVRLRDGQFVEHWNIVDQLGLMQQLGVIPSPA